MSDLRSLGFERANKRMYCLKKYHNCEGVETYRITVPKQIAKQFEECYFNFFDIGNGKLIMVSGARHGPMDFSNNDYGVLNK